MGTYRHIACCIDEDEVARAVLAEALVFAQFESDVALSVVHVLAPDLHVYPHGITWSRTVVGAAVDAWLGSQAAKLPNAQPVLLKGPDTARTVCAWAAATGVDLLIAGRHHGRFERTVLGSFTGYLAYHASCATLLARPSAPSRAVPSRPEPWTELAHEHATGSLV